MGLVSDRIDQLFFETFSQFSSCLCRCAADMTKVDTTDLMIFVGTSSWAFMHNQSIKQYRHGIHHTHTHTHLYFRSGLILPIGERLFYITETRQNSKSSTTIRLSPAVLVKSDSIALNLRSWVWDTLKLLNLPQIVFSLLTLDVF